MNQLITWPENRGEIMELMEPLRTENIPVLVWISNFMWISQALCQTVIEVCNGKVHYDGSPEGISRKIWKSSTEVSHGWLNPSSSPSLSQANRENPFKSVVDEPYDHRWCYRLFVL